MNWTHNTIDNSLELTIDEQTRVNYYCDYPETDSQLVNVELVVYKNNRMIATSQKTSDWNIINRYVPRNTWPTQMNAGQKYDNNRNPNPQLQSFTDDFIHNMED